MCIKKCGRNRSRGKKVEKNIFTIADFVNVEPFMKYAEVMQLLGVTSDKEYPPVGNFTPRIFNLNDGSKMRLLFSAQDYLIYMSIIDPGGRVFILQAEDTFGN
jgi:hypothetical protein